MSASGGVEVRPLYARRTDDPSQPWRASSAWRVAQRVDHPDPAAANTLALLDLEGGADMLALVAAASPWSRNFGLPEPSALAIALERVELDLISLRLDAGCRTAEFGDVLAKLVQGRRLGAAALDIDLGYDPIGVWARTGRAPEPSARMTVVEVAGKAGLSGCPLLADGRPWHEAGAGEAQELALVLASAVAHMRALEVAGLTLHDARRAIAVLLSFDTDVLVGLAKARALRRLWARLEQACGLSPRPVRLHAETSWRMMARRDPHTNAMRTAAAAFAAALGGADSIAVLPMTLAAGLPDQAARRLARNTGRIMIDEVGLDLVDDPAAGSGALDTLTEDLCREAWAVFASLEGSGGIETALRDGRVRAMLAASADKRRHDVETLARGIVGTNRFPSLDAPACDVLDVPPLPPRAAADGLLASRRDAEPFEALRDNVEAATAGLRRPSVFLATIGEPAAFRPRATSAANLFATVGVATCSPADMPRDVAAAMDAFRSSGAHVACLCGDDGGYNAQGAAMVAALRNAGAGHVLVMDGCIADAETLRQSGAAALEVLRRTCELMLGMQDHRETTATAR